MPLKLLWIALLALAIPAALAAQDRGSRTEIGEDRYLSGARVVHSAGGARDVFMAGGRVLLEARVSGSAHMAGRVVRLAAQVGENVYAMGMDVAIDAAVSGNATLAAYDLQVTAPVAGALRAGAARIAVRAPVSGHVLLAGDEIHLEAPVAGDAVINAGEISFGPEARIEGTLTLYLPRGARAEVPDRVIAADRVTLAERPEWRGPEGVVPRVSPWRMIRNFIGGVLVVAALAALVAAVAPEGLAGMRRRILARPFGTLGYGFLALSASIGAAVVLALTLVGIFLSPAALVLAGLGLFAGYVIGAYSFGAGVLIAIGRGEPQAIGQRALAALLGALLAGLIALIPLLGWLFVLALALAGAGALTLRMFRPAFFVAEPL